jgi:hypothetical protein
MAKRHVRGQISPRQKQGEPAAAASGRRTWPPLRTFSVNLTGRPQNSRTSETTVLIHLNGQKLTLAGSVSVNRDEGFGFVNLYPTAKDYDAIAKAARHAKRHAARS